MVQEQMKIQQIPLKVYRSSDRLMIAAPMAGLEPEDISVQVSANGHMVIRGNVRGMLKDIKDKELLVDEWSVGTYYREFDLGVGVDAGHANMNYGNGVLVVAFPLAEGKTVPVELHMDRSGVARGVRSGNAGHSS